MKFIVDKNVGKLLRWLRLMGYDTLFFDGTDDQEMVVTALHQGRAILTRDTQITRRRVATSGRLRVLLLTSEMPEQQIKQVITELGVDPRSRPFSRCLECNHLLLPRVREEVAGRVPPYVFQTQEKYMECPGCHRIYWRGTHWQAMLRRLEQFAGVDPSP